MNVVFSLISQSGSDVTFRTDRWVFTQEDGSIGGRVWEDVDGDGAEDAGEPGINGVVVELLDSTTTVAETTITAGDGEYQFVALPWDGYTVAILSGTLPAGASPTADPDGVASPHTATLILGCGDSSSANDFGYGPVPPQPVSSMTLAKNPVDPNQIDVGYDTSTCNASDHAVFYGLLGDYSTVITADCSIGNSGSVTTTAPPGNVWLLVVGHEGARYSSVGPSTAGELSLAGVDAQCPTLLSQDVSAICP